MITITFMLSIPSHCEKIPEFQKTIVLFRKNIDLKLWETTYLGIIFLNVKILGKKIKKKSLNENFPLNMGGGRVVFEWGWLNMKGMVYTKYHVIKIIWNQNSKLTPNVNEL